MDPMDTSMEDVFTCPDPYIPPPRRPKQSLLASLRSRELGLNRRRSPVIEARRMYQSIYPNTTIHGVDCQFSNLKRFTPCGQVIQDIASPLPPTCIGLAFAHMVLGSSLDQGCGLDF